MKEHAILVFGEDDNDRRSISNLLRAILLEKQNVDILVRRSPTILSREAKRKRVDMAKEILAFCTAEKLRRKRVNPVVHRDCNSVEPAHKEEEKVLRELLQAVGLSGVVVATPAWEIEAWWMLFPKALHDTRKCWKQVNYGSQNVGMIQNAKERLRRDLRPDGAGSRSCPDFAKIDGVLISEKIAEHRLIHQAISARSEVLQSFRRQVEIELR